MIDGLAFGAFLILLLFVGMRQRADGEEGFLLAKRATPLFALTATLVMTEFNTSTLLAFSSMGYVAGRWALFLPAVFLIGLLFYAITVAKKWKELDGYSVAQLFTQRYGKGVGRIASLSLLAAMGGFSATYVKSVALLFAPILPWSLWAISALLVTTMLLMTLRGGLASVIRTDMVSFVVICVFMGMLVLFAGKATPTDLPATPLPGRFIISLIVLTMFTYILAPWYAQKIFAAQNERVAFLSVALSALIVFALYGAAVLATARLRGTPLASADLALPTLMHQVLPRGFLGLGYGVLFAASATTLAGVWSAMSTMVVGDFLKGPGSVLRGRLLTVVFALLSYLLGNTLVDRILDKLILANIPVAALSFALLAGFYWKGATSLGATLSIATGLLWGTGCYLFLGDEGLYTWPWAIYGIPLIFATGISGSLLERRFSAVTTST